MSNFKDFPDSVKLWCPNEKKWLRHQREVWSCGCFAKQDLILISVITAVKDRELQFLDALRSLNVQELRHDSKKTLEVEHVVQDGGGVPNRYEVIEKYSQFHTIYSQLFDGGLYPAFNVGFELCSGDYVSYLNSDDAYSPDFIQKSFQVLEISGADWTFGNIIIDFGSGKSVYIEGKTDYFLSPWANFSRFHHNTVLARRGIFEAVGLFPVELLGRKILFCADYWWFMSAQKKGFIGVYIPSLIGYMKWGGASSSDEKLIYNEAIFVASVVYPEKQKIIRFVWKLRLLDNKYLSKFHSRILRKVRIKARWAYGVLIRVSHKSSGGIGRANERVV